MQHDAPLHLVDKSQLESSENMLNNTSVILHTVLNNHQFILIEVLQNRQYIKTLTKLLDCNTTPEQHCVVYIGIAFISLLQKKTSRCL